MEADGGHFDLWLKTCELWVLSYDLWLLSYDLWLLSYDLYKFDDKKMCLSVTTSFIIFSRRHNDIDRFIS